MPEQDGTTFAICPPPKNVEDLTGRRFTRLLVIGYVPDVRPRSHWFCRCDCGTERVFSGRNLARGDAKSCGCLRKETFVRRATKHGMSRSHEYRCWLYMMGRCNGTNRNKRHLYMDRGITVCKEWVESFEAFLSHIGPAPSPKHSIDRFPDQDGNYEPGNVRWATSREQTRNMRRNRMITIDGRTQCAGDWCDELGVDRRRIYYRIGAGWDPVVALLTPALPRS